MTDTTPSSDTDQDGARDRQSLNRLRPKSDPAIFPIDERFTEPAKELWARRFGGKEEFMENWLADAMIDSDAPTQGFVAVDHGRLAGFGIATVSTADYARDYFAVDIDLNPWKQTGIQHIGVVHEDYESRGIGSELFKRRLQWMAGAAEAGGAVGTAWHRDDHHDSRGIFEKFGFTEVATIDEYYTNCDGYVGCPLCEDSCSCDATIYRREFNVR